MNTNLNIFQEVSNTASALVNQIQRWPAALLLGVCLIMLCAALKILGLSDRRSMVVVFVVGTGMTVLLGDPSKVAHHHPRIILAMWGFLVSCLALIAFKVLLKRFERFLPVLSLEDDDGDDEAKAKTKPPEKDK